MPAAGPEYYPAPRFAPEFSTAWDCVQFASGKLEESHRLLFLAELVGDSAAYERYAADVRFFTRAAAAADREWRKKSQ